MTAEAAEAPIPFTHEEAAAMVKRRPAMARVLELGREMGIAVIVEQEKNGGVINAGSNSKK